MPSSSRASARLDAPGELARAVEKEQRDPRRAAARERRACRRGSRFGRRSVRSAAATARNWTAAAGRRSAAECGPRASRSVASIVEAIGLNTVTATIPTSSATSTAGVRNCQTETPAARATTSSLLRVSRQNASIVPNRMANGITSCAVCGSFSAAISSSSPSVACVFAAAAAQQLDIVEQKGDAEHGAEDAAEPDEELARDIGRKGLRELQRPQALLARLYGQRAGTPANCNRRKLKLIPRCNRIPNPNTNGSRSMT